MPLGARFNRGRNIKCRLAREGLNRTQGFGSLVSPLWRIVVHCTQENQIRIYGKRVSSDI